MFSDSAGDTHLYLKEPLFKGCEATVEFHININKKFIYLTAEN